jgi:hypothetical protein
LTPSLAATRFHCDRCDKPLSLLTALAKASQFSKEKPIKKENKKQIEKRERMKSWTFQKIRSSY